MTNIWFRERERETKENILKEGKLPWNTKSNSMLCHRLKVPDDAYPLRAERDRSQLESR